MAGYSVLCARRSTLGIAIGWAGDTGPDRFLWGVRLRRRHSASGGRDRSSFAVSHDGLVTIGAEACVRACFTRTPHATHLGMVKSCTGATTHPC